MKRDFKQDLLHAVNNVLNREIETIDDLIIELKDDLFEKNIAGIDKDLNVANSVLQILLRDYSLNDLAETADTGETDSDTGYSDIRWYLDDDETTAIELCLIDDKFDYIPDDQRTECIRAYIDPTDSFRFYDFSEYDFSEY